MVVFVLLRPGDRWSFRRQRLLRLRLIKHRARPRFINLCRLTGQRDLLGLPCIGSGLLIISRSFFFWLPCSGANSSNTCGGILAPFEAMTDNVS